MTIMIMTRMTKQGRESLVKTVKTLGDQAKQSVQQTRKQCNATLRNYAKGSVSEDEVRNLEKQMQTMVDATMGRIEKTVASKSEDVMAVAVRKT